MSLSPRELEEAKAALQKAVKAGLVALPVSKSPKIQREPLNWSEYAAARRRKFRDKGLCTHCGRERDRIDQRTGKTALQCSVCHKTRTKAKARQRSRTKDGCTNCGRPHDRINRRTGKPARWCSSCLDSHARSKRRKALHVSPTL